MSRADAVVGYRATVWLRPGAAQPWLPQPLDWTNLTAEAQLDDSASHLSLYRAALAIRRQHPALGDGRLDWVEAGDEVLCFDRDPGSGACQLRRCAMRAPRTARCC